ncbi:MAG: hypothetical protein HY902_06580 [Deltaproteobacteria bacterium]|nr:hypothetical protein [Deltaproteobacteria bacterium]
MANQGDRRCPRCQTRNARARTNCEQCGAVLLGVDPIDFDQMARAAGGSVARPQQPAGHRAPTANNRRAHKSVAAQVPAKKAKRGLGCFWSLLFWTVVIAAVANSGASQPLRRAALDLASELPLPARHAINQVLREFVMESELLPDEPPRPVAHVDVPPAPPPALPSEPLLAAPTTPDPPAEPALPRVPPEVDAAIVRSQSKLLRCASLAKAGEDLQAAFAVDIKAGRIVGVPRLLLPAAHTPWTTCWLAVIQKLRLPASTEAGQYRLELSVADESAKEK